MIEIKYNDMLTAINDAIVEKGSDFVYKALKEGDGWGDDGCAYVHPDEDGNMVVPGCLVGDALIRLGVPVEFLADNNIGIGAHSVMDRLEKAGVATSTPKARFLATRVQNVQDGGGEWGEAVAEAVTKTAERTWRDNEERMYPLASMS